MLYKPILQPAKVLFNNNHIVTYGKKVRCHVIHLVAVNMKEIIIPKNIYKLQKICFFPKAAFINNPFVFTHRLKAAVKVQCIVTGLYL